MKPRLRVAVLTRTGRESGRRMAEAVDASRHILCGFVAEHRSSMWRRALRRRSALGVLRGHGAAFVCSRILQAVVQRISDAVRPCGTWPAMADSVPRRSVPSLNSGETVSLLRSWAPDILVVANAPVLKPYVFDWPPLGALNFHSGRLPEYGGLASEFWALFNGEAQAWVTLHRVTAMLDCGEILAEEPLPINDRDSPETLHARAIETGSALLVRLLDSLSEGKEPDRRQPGPPVLHGWPSRAEKRTLRLRLLQSTKR